MFTDQHRKKPRVSARFPFKNLSQTCVCTLICALVDKGTGLPVTARHPPGNVEHHANIQGVQRHIIIKPFFNMNSEPCLAVAFCWIMHAKADDTRTEYRAITIQNEFTLDSPFR